MSGALTTNKFKVTGTFRHTTWDRRPAIWKMLLP
jgi:hypothetical protein